MILIFMFFIFYLISMIFMILNFLLAKKKMTDREKSSPFECGFDPFSSSRLPFSIQFYMISIIFLIFDVEIIIFIPMIPSFSQSNLYLWMNMSMYFISLLILGLYIEWNDGALKWLK